MNLELSNSEKLRKTQRRTRESDNLINRNSDHLSYSESFWNQKGMVPMILIIGAVIIALGVIVTLVKLALPRMAKPSPSPSPAAVSQFSPNNPKYKGCEDRDYTGCDGKEVFTWKDDGKR